MSEATFAVVTDSGSDLPADLARELGIRVVPLSIHFGEETFLDGVTLDGPSFYKRLVEDRQHPPHTTQPTPGAFHEAYGALREQGVRQVLSVHLSSKLSGTIQSAALARGEFDDMEILLVDSLSASMGIGFLALEGARMAREGRSLAEAAEHLETVRNRLQIVFAVDTLEYLARNGRIGRAQSLLGGLLSIKPVLAVVDGEIAPVERTRGKNRALQELVRRTVEYLGDRPARVAVIHSQAEEAATIRAQLEERCRLEDVQVTLLGPTIGTHAGPGTVGVVALPV
ncbi:DegV family protein [Limnochorda pilosa]|uniref:DegV family protein n=1 Tax=Limnochorda pilosa TaxID=1555112 RepID=A0A0K2SK07_LIMPI|nr:DegV family protein [Limnochorda pilosa]BAS27451.1 hypothetical protein LIP_1605 [Limnochorda pilosa]